MEIKITLYAQHHTSAGFRVMDCEEGCESDDHIHLSFDSKEDAENWITQAIRRHTGFALRAAKAIREEISYHSFDE